MSKLLLMLIFLFTLTSSVFADNRDQIIAIQEVMLSNARQIHEYQGKILNIKGEILAIVKDNKDKKKKEIKGLIQPKREQIKEYHQKIKELRAKNKAKRQEMKSLRKSKKDKEVADAVPAE